ncbi:MAG: integrase [Candidatus Accumulibacter meliphilus]|uniref:Integrase n=1 Tax=Candidatus Accumulibacter meliphilus TaxID=2211374 RepID=A0A369XLD4_9PROT|nr:MAG: integrase [Candidatus Accumulibacter meliphilus]
MKPANTFPLLLQAFFLQWLGQQRNCSANTVRSYRDTWRLFLRFVAKRKERLVAKLSLPDLTAAEVTAFLQYVEDERKDSIGTRNCRLAALRSFFAYVADRDPSAAAQCAEALRIPTKRAMQPALRALELDEVSAILAQPNRANLEGQRDHALLSFLYNTGARIQEALDVCPQAIHFDSPAYVRLLGKGRKERFCPLWPETIDLLKALLKRRPRAESEPIFANRYGKPLGASGFRYKLDHYVAAAAKQVPSLIDKKVTPHRFRHATAVHLIAAGVDVSVIRSWLGHASLDTTNHYAQANIETKRRALEAVDHMAMQQTLPSWKKNADILDWLDSL